MSLRAASGGPSKQPHLGRSRPKRHPEKPRRMAVSGLNLCRGQNIWSHPPVPFRLLCLFQHWSILEQPIWSQPVNSKPKLQQHFWFFSWPFTVIGFQENEENMVNSGMSSRYRRQMSIVYAFLHVKTNSWVELQIVLPSKPQIHSKLWARWWGNQCLSISLLHRFVWMCGD